MKHTVEIEDTETGEKRLAHDETAVTADGLEFLWAEGNYACDCNRGSYFACGVDPSVEPAFPCSGRRFRVAKLALEDGREIAIDP